MTRSRTGRGAVASQRYARSLPRARGDELMAAFSSDALTRRRDARWLDPPLAAMAVLMARAAEATLLDRFDAARACLPGLFSRNPGGGWGAHTRTLSMGSDHQIGPNQ